MRYTIDQYDAASDAVGYRIGYQQMENAIEACRHLSQRAQIRLLIELQKQFENNGGRGIALAERIDELKISIAALTYAPSPND